MRSKINEKFLTGSNQNIFNLQQIPIKIICINKYLEIKIRELLDHKFLHETFKIQTYTLQLQIYADIITFIN